MCGIAGLFQTGAAPGAESAVHAMAWAQRHRGPDGLASWLSSSGNAALAHARLSVFDTSDRGRQPMSIEDGRYTITYSGAIYNFRDVRRPLEQSGVSFRSQTDTEVILRLYEKYGEQCVEHLRGMFAFAIWDERERTGLLARDMLGIKPLYYSDQPGRILFASEVRALAASGLVSREIDPAALDGYFRHGSVPEPATLLQAVRMLPAGAAAVWKNNTLSIRRAQVPPWDLGITTNGHAIEATREALRDSVVRHCAADVPVGVFLSGGIDSAAIAALATHSNITGLCAFSLAFPGSPEDEGENAGRTARQFGLRHEVLQVDAAVARPQLTDYLQALDQPTIDGLNTFITSRLARNHGVRVALSGVGADELFGGYPSFWRVPSLNRLHRLAAAVPLGAAAGRGVARRSASPRARRVADLLDRQPSIAAAYQTFRGVFTRSESERLVRHFTKAEFLSQPEAAPAAASTPAETISVLELTQYVRNQLLRDGDVMSMASGVELRTPFLDRELLAVLWSIPPGTRIQPGKKLLRQAVPELPPWTWSGPKRCFQLPLDYWMRHQWRGMFESIEHTMPVPMQNWYRSWCIAALQSALGNINNATGRQAIH